MHKNICRAAVPPDTEDDIHTHATHGLSTQMYTQTGALQPRRTVRVELQRAHRPGTGARRPATGTDVQVVGSHTHARTHRRTEHTDVHTDRQSGGKSV